MCDGWMDAETVLLAVGQHIIRLKYVFRAQSVGTTVTFWATHSRMFSLVETVIYHRLVQLSNSNCSVASVLTI
jgi:hypothetical protein